ncbi:MAG: cytochrome c biogenesis protein CcdA [Planctomycetota bacterium]
MMRFLSALLAAWCLVGGVLAQDSESVTIDARFVPEAAAPGDEVVLEVIVNVAEGWHVYGSRETVSKPLEVLFDDTGALRVVGKTLVPPGTQHDRDGLTSYELTGKITLRQRMKVPATTSGAQSVLGRVVVNACDENHCDPEVEMPFLAKLAIGTGPAEDGQAVGEPAQSTTPAPVVSGQDPGFGAAFGADETRVRATARFEPATATAGSKVDLIVSVEVVEGWHVYGSAETGSPPTRLELLDTGELRPEGDAKVPPGIEHATEFITTYDLHGRFEIVQSLDIPPNAGGVQTVKAKVHYQACDATSCERPTSVEVTAILNLGGSGKASSIAPITFDVHVEPGDPRPGEAVDVVIRARLIDGVNVYGNRDGEPIRLSVTDPRFGPIGSNRLPDGQPRTLEDKSRFVLSGDFEIRQAYRVPADLAAGSINLPIQLRYELVDADGRLPRSSDLTASLAVTAGEVRQEYNGVRFEIEGLGGLSGILLLAFFAGLFALLMPCTYPMIPITISFFTKQATVRGGTATTLALTYGIGIVLIFILIGVLFGPVIVPFATHWLTNAIIAAIFFVFALSLFGLINLQPPQFLMQLAGNASTRGGYGGVFLMGATLVISSFTCTVPFVGALLGIAARGGTLYMLAGMAVFGLTMAVPFVFLSLIPSRLRRMPKAGEWMNSLKVFLGFVELAAATKFLSNVDLAINASPVWLPRSLFLWIWTAVFVAAAVYLLLPLVRRVVAPAPMRLLGIALSLAFAGWCGYGATGAALDPVMTAIAPPSDLGKHVKIKDDYELAIQTAKSQQKLLFVNFTGFT